MKFKELYLVIIIIIVNIINSFSQSLTDTIYTNQDTIICDITLINDQNIFYTLKLRNRLDHRYILLNDVISYKLGPDELPDTINEKNNYLIQFDTLNFWISGISWQVQLNYPMAHFGLMYSLFKKNHNIQLGAEYLQLQRTYLKGDPIDKWETSYYALYMGYRYFLKSNSPKLNWFCFFSYTIFNATYLEYQRGFPFEKEVTEVIFLNSAGLGVNFKANSNINIYSGIGLSSSKGFFLNFEEPYFNLRFGVEYRFIRKLKDNLPN